MSKARYSRVMGERRGRGTVRFYHDCTIFLPSIQCYGQRRKVDDFSLSREKRLTTHRHHFRNFPLFVIFLPFRFDFFQRIIICLSLVREFLRLRFQFL